MTKRTPMNSALKRDPAATKSALADAAGDRAAMRRRAGANTERADRSGHRPNPDRHEGLTRSAGRSRGDPVR